MSRTTITVLALGICMLRGIIAAGAQDAEEQKPSLLRLESVMVEPSEPGPDTLCKLRVAVRNDGDEIASQLDFKVRINGQELAVYRNQLFMYPVEPKQTSEIKLYNFWTTETSRSMPKDGKLTVEVSLVEARWMKIEMEDDVEVWTPLADVDGLPVSQSVTLSMSKTKS